jgi:multidrug efflux pump
MFLNVTLANDERESLVIPEQALTPEAERQYVFVVSEGKAERREVRIGGRRPGSVEVLAGLVAGEQVIVEGTQKVRDGVAVRTTEVAAESLAGSGEAGLARSKQRRAGKHAAIAGHPRMIISDLSVRRPVLATVMSLLLFILGLAAAFGLSLREFPDIDRPVVNIETRYRGASSDVVETRITQIIENEISGIEGVERLNSASRDERSQINVEFSLERDLDAAANDVRERLSRVAQRLPQEADPSQITKVDSGTDPIVWINVTSSQRSILELTDYMSRYLVDQFSTLEGVANVRINGGRRYAMRVWLSRENLAARQLTVADVENSLLRENVELPAGRLESTEREFTLRTDTNLRTEEDFNNLVVGRGADGYLVRLGEVAEVRLAADDDRSISRSNGIIGLSMAIIPQSKANVLATSRAVKERLAEVQKNLPKDITAEINIDNGIFIAASLKNVLFALSETLILVLIVIFLFLGTLRATLIPAVTIPVSIIAAATVMLMLGYSINTLTLLAADAAIGLVSMTRLSCSRTSCGVSRPASRSALAADQRFA